MVGIKICSGPLWNSSLTWYTDQPDFTSCFHKTVLVFLPCFFLWFMTPLELWLNLKNRGRFIPWNWVNLTKLSLNGLLSLISVIELCFVVWLYESNKELPQVADFIAPVVKIASFCLTMRLILLAKRSGKSIRVTLLLSFKRFLGERIMKFKG